MNIYPSVKCAGSHIIKDPLEELVAGAVRNSMVNIDEIIHMLELICKIESVGMTFGSLPSQIVVRAVAHQSAMKCDVI